MIAVNRSSAPLVKRRPIERPARDAGGAKQRILFLTNRAVNRLKTQEALRKRTHSEAKTNW